MKLENQLFVKEAINAFVLLRKHKKIVLIATIIDCLFFYAYGLLGGGLTQKLTELFENIVIGVLPGIKQGNAIIDLLFFPNVYPLTTSFLFNLLLLILLIFVLYIVFQGINFWLANNLVKKISYKDYLISFAKVNLLWILGFVVYNIIDLIGRLQERFDTITTGLETTNYWSIIAKILIFLIIYFALISYTKLNLKNAFVIGTKKFKQLFFLLISSLVIILVLMFVLTNLFNAVINYENGEQIFVVIGAVLLFPTMFFLRLYWALCVNKVK